MLGFILVGCLSLCPLPLSFGSAVPVQCRWINEEQAEAPDDFLRLQVNPYAYKEERDFLADSLKVKSYGRQLRQGFIDDLRSLGPDAVWVDSGCSIKAIYDYVTGFGRNRARVIGINPFRPSKNTHLIEELYRDHSAQVRLIGQKTEDVESIPASSVELISDAYSPGAYAEPFDRVIRKYLTWLKVGGKAYVSIGLQTYLRVTRTVTRKRFFFFGEEITVEETELIHIKEYLETIPGVRLIPPEYPTSSSYKFVLEKVSENFEVPELNFLGYGKAEFPPLPFRQYSRAK
ncbi:MAG: hypothetical protein C5B49_02605 [Bdellovibrio sp.]|nr:MAG: hypothetical protein C5B49_02605 [Bdellovibrio sp.]